MLDHRMGYAVLGWSKSGRVAAGSSSCGQQGTLQQGIWCRGDRRFHGVRRTGSRWSWLLPGGFRGSHGLWDWRQLLPSGCHQLGPGVRSRWKVWRVRKHQELTPLDQQCNSEYLKRHWANRAIQQIVKVAFSGGKIHYIWHTKNVTANKNRCWGNWLYVLCYPPKDRSLWRPWWAPPISIDLWSCSSARRSRVINFIFPTASPEILYHTSVSMENKRPVNPQVQSVHSIIPG